MSKNRSKIDGSRSDPTIRRNINEPPYMDDDGKIWYPMSPEMQRFFEPGVLERGWEVLARLGGDRPLEDGDAFNRAPQQMKDLMRRELAAAKARLAPTRH
jgi:hypothetical protein